MLPPNGLIEVIKLVLRFLNKLRPRRVHFDRRVNQQCVVNGVDEEAGHVQRFMTAVRAWLETFGLLEIFFSVGHPTQ